jgi:hypothetical protein
MMPAKAHSMIIELGDSEYATLYGYKIIDDCIELNYRYTGNKPKHLIEKLITDLVIKAFNKAGR